MKVTEKLLEEINKTLRERNVDHKSRPWEALSILSKEYNVTVCIPSSVSDFVFNWFEKHAKPGSQRQAPQHQGAYFYDSEFWPVSIPIIFGQIKFNSMDSLVNMPENIKNELMEDRKSAWDYIVFWSDCIDMGMGISEVKFDDSLDEFGIQFLSAGYDELVSATSLLLETQPNTRAIMNCRMACEMFLKSFIALKQGLTEKEARKLGHDLHKLFDSFIESSGFNHLTKMKELLSIFPGIHKRYESVAVQKKVLAEAYTLAQSFGVLIIREFTNRNTLEQMLAPQKH